ncbi:MAG: iron-sulfur cluster assembly protein [Marivirga sp.]|jgi:iron-sulfur cluster assembly protein
MELPVDITPEALREVKNIMESKNIPAGYGLRIGVRGGGGCSVAAMNYMLGFDHKKATDKEFSLEGIPVYIEKSHFMYIIGTRVIYVNDNNQTGFVFEKD